MVLGGVDIGGTFTDLVCWVDGNLRSVKVPSTPDDYARGFLDALGRLGLPFSSIDEILHGTTVATNALLERKGARCGMVTTKGFRDVLELGRRTRSAVASNGIEVEAMAASVVAVAGCVFTVAVKLPVAHEAG